MLGPSFKDLASLMKRQPKIQRPDAPDAEKWLNNFTLWLEECYAKVVPHERDESVIHCSSMYQVCARKEWLIRKYSPAPEHILAGQQLTFDIGHAMHWWWQHRYLGPRQELWGDWLCSGCKSKTRGFMPMNCSCGMDWRIGVSYLEMEARDDKLGYIGHTDGVLVDRTSDHRRIFEFKSISDYEYKKLKAPKSAHVIQAHAYMRALGPMEALIVYANKGIQCEWERSNGDLRAGKINIKPYIVKFDTDLWSEIEKRIKDRKEALKELNAILDGGSITEAHIAKCSRICETKDDDAAKYCPVREQCFRLRAPEDASKPVGEFSISL